MLRIHTRKEVGGTAPALLKAMGCGNCIIALDVPFHREVLEDAGLYFRNALELQEQIELWIHKALSFSNRKGYNGKVFRISKFRTMRFPFTQDYSFTSPGDKRLTRIGRFLRKYNLDELPQIFNVLNRDMSLVGPRPISVKDRFFFEHNYFMFRLMVKPCLTGWA